MGQGRATTALLQWVAASKSDVSGWVADWFPRMRDGDSVRLTEAAIKDGVFANPANREAVQSAFTLWQSQRN